MKKFFSKKVLLTLITLASAFILTTSFMLFRPFTVNASSTDVTSTGSGGYEKLCTQEARCDVSGDRWFTISYTIYSSNTIYEDIGVAMVSLPTTYKVGDVVTFTQKAGSTVTYTVAETMSNTLSSKLGAELEIGTDLIKSSISSEITTSMTESYSKEVSASATVLVETSDKITRNYDGYSAVMLQSKFGKHVVVKADVIKHTKQYNGAGTETGVSEEIVMKDKEVFSKLLPYYKGDNSHYSYKVEVWNSADDFYSELRNEETIHGIEVKCVKNPNTVYNPSSSCDHVFQDMTGPGGHMYHVCLKCGWGR